VEFTTFKAHVEPFKPKLNNEHSSHTWIAPAEALKKLPLHPGVRHTLSESRAKKASGGAAEAVPIVAAGGEYVLSPHQVQHVAGAGDLERGQRVLDEWVKRMRKQTVKTLQKLPGPKKD